MLINWNSPFEQLKITLLNILSYLCTQESQSADTAIVPQPCMSPSRGIHYGQYIYSEASNREKSADRVCPSQAGPVGTARSILHF